MTPSSTRTLAGATGRVLSICGLAAAIVVGCAQKLPKPQVADRPIALDPVQLADQIDPGPQPPISELLPVGMRSWLASQRPDATSPEDLASTWAGLIAEVRTRTEGDGVSDFSGILTSAALAAQTLAISEQLFEGHEPKSAVNLERSIQFHAFSTLLLDTLGSEAGLNVVQAILAQLKENPDGAEWMREAQAMFAENETVVARIRAHELRAIAGLLRHDESAAVVKGLELLMNYDRRLGRCDRAVSLGAAMMQRAADPSVASAATLATAYYVQLNLDHGDSILDESSDDLDLVRQARSAREAAVAVLAAPNTIQRQHLHGRLLLEHGCTETASAIFEQIIERAPTDARGFLGRAWVINDQSLSSTDALVPLRQAIGFNNRDESFYRTAVGMHGAELLALLGTMLSQDKEKASQRLEEHRESLAPFLVGLSEYAPAEAALLELVYATLSGVFASESEDPLDFNSIFAATLPSLRRLRQQFPESVSVAKIHLTAAIIVGREASPGERHVVLADLLMPLPASADSATGLTRLLGYVSVMGVDWRSETLDRLVTDIPDDSPSGHGRATGLALAMALRAMQTDEPKAWSSVATAFGGHRTVKEPPHGVNNEVVARVLAGDLEKAAERMLEFFENESNEIQPANRLTLAVLSLRRGEFDADTVEQVLAVVHADEEAAFLRSEVTRWLAHIEKTGGDGQTAAELVCRAEREATENGRRVVLGERVGLALPGSFAIGFGLKAPDDLQLELNLDITPWLFLRAPAVDGSGACQ